LGSVEHWENHARPPAAEYSLDMHIVIMSYDNMHLQIDHSQTPGPKEQIKSQIRLLISTGQLAEGQSLPSSRDLAELLSVNRNTTWAAYRELAVEGWVVSAPGAGTKVRGPGIDPRMGDLVALFDQTLLEAEQLGFSPQQAAELLQAYATGRPSSVAGRKVLVVECNEEALKDLARALEKELGLKTETAYIQEIEADPQAAQAMAGKVDLVVCGFNHLEEYLRAVPDSPAPALPVMLAPDAGIVTSIVKELSGLPAGAKVGMVCANQRSTEALYRHQVFHSGASLQRLLVPLDDAEAMKKLCQDCNLILASYMVYEQVKKLAGKKCKVVKVDLTPDPAALAAVRECLAMSRGRES
jgi:GntR family transcriptional regulator